MKILFLTLRFPYPPNRGDKIRAYNFIKHLSENHSHSITLISFAHSKEDFDQVSHLEPYCESIKLVKFNPLEAYANLGMGFLSKDPLQVSYFRSSKMYKEVEAAIKNGNFDLLHVHLFRMASYVLGFDKPPSFLDLCDSISLNLQRRAKLDGGWLWPLLKLEESRVRRYEIEVAQRFNLAGLVSEVDMNYMLGLKDDLSLCLVPLGVDLEYFKPPSDGFSGPKAEADSNQLLFTGTMSYFPNWDAVCYFHAHIFPRIVSNLPDTKFYIVGNQPHKKVWKLAESKNVMVTGKVADVRPYFQRASAFVCPLRSGSGVQAKILEAMAMGTPVITTSIGLEGLEAIPGRDVLVADDPKEFAKKTIDLMQDRHLRQQLRQNARSLVESQYSWNSVVKLLNATYEKVQGLKD